MNGDLPKPPPNAPPRDLQDIKFHEMKSSVAKAPLWERTYQECVEKGKKRAELMKSSLGFSEKTQEKQKTFVSLYKTEIIAHDDDKQTRKAVLSYWKGRESEESFYKNTPYPENGCIFSWQNKREKGEVLQNSDIYFFQYQWIKEQQGQEKVPPLHYLIRQQARGEDTENVYNHIRFRDQREVLSGIWDEGHEAFYALLGTTNGTGPAFLVIDHGQALQIKTVTQIKLEANWDTTYYFA